MNRTRFLLRFPERDQGKSDPIGRLQNNGWMGGGGGLSAAHCAAVRRHARTV